MHCVDFKTRWAVNSKLAPCSDMYRDPNRIKVMINLFIYIKIPPAFISYNKHTSIILVLSE